MDKYIEKSIDAISDVLKNDSSNFLVSLKILFPKDSSLSVLKSIVCLHPCIIDKNEYSALDKYYVSDGQDNSEIKKTLTFSKYKQILRYQKVKQSNQTILSKPTKKYRVMPETDLTTGDKNKWTKDEKTINRWWKDWGLCIQKKFCYGQSTLWSYVLLRDEKNEEYIASAYAIFSRELKGKEQILINKHCQELLIQLIVQQYNKELVDFAVRAALAQVMARNLSHNLGSHVLVRVIEMIKNILFYNFEIYKRKYLQCDIENPNILHQCDEKLKASICEIFDAIIGISQTLSCEENEINRKTQEANEQINATTSLLKNANFKGIEYIVTLLGYIKVRMDYIADITTSTPVMENAKSLHNEVVSGFLDNRLLVDTISGIDNFYFKIVETYPNGQHDVLLSIPNDVLGNHAFYTILENLIRNTAKHSKVETSKEKPLVFEIKVEGISESEIDEQDRETIKSVDDYDEMYAISVIIKNDIQGEVSLIKNENGKWTETKENNCEAENIDEIDWLIYQLNSRINDSVIENNKLRQGGWGLLEMEASAAYLRKIPMEDIEDDNYDICILDNDKSTFTLDTNFYNKSKEIKRLYIFKAYKVIDNGQNYLAYRFFVYKPREILIVGDTNSVFTDTTKWNKAKENEWLKAGIKIVAEIENNTVYPHRLVVDYTNNEKLSDNACLSKQITKPTEKIDCSKEISCVKKEIWDGFSNSFKKDRIGYLDYDTLTRANNDAEHKTNLHGKGYWESLNKDNAEKYIEIITSNNKQWTDPDIRTKWRENKNDKWKLVNWRISCNTKIKVVDERIQHFALNNYYPTETGDKISYYTIYKYTNILVPATKNYQPDPIPDSNKFITIDNADCLIDLNEQNFDASYLNIIKYIQKEDNIDFLVIHLGIIEKLISSYNGEKRTSYDKEKPEKVGQFIQEVLCNNNLRYDNIIVISGRGKPHNLPENIRFLNYSIAAQYLIDRRCKYAFAEAIHSARKFNNK
jgi:hypothetical protein